MKILLLLCILFATSCLKPVSAYIGMSYDSFKDLCQVTDSERFNSVSNGVVNTQGSFFTLTLENTVARQEKGLAMKGCIGKFTFHNNKLDTIH